MSSQNKPPQQQQQRAVIHPKLRGKLENWQRNQAALSAADSLKQNVVDVDESVVDSKSTGKRFSIV